MKTTKDLALVAALVIHGHKPAHIQSTLGWATVSFTATDELQKAIDDYYANKLNVPALEFSNTIKQLKTQIHELPVKTVY